MNPLGYVMSFLTETYLINYSRSKEGIAAKSENLVLKSQAKLSIFLSHSHRDIEAVEGLINLLAYFSATTLYVDWQDSGMPSVTNRETAQRLKEKIIELDFFLVLGTKNALESRWVPWEIGVADSAKSLEKIAIIPIIDPSGNFYGSEYLQLYQTIEITKAQRLGVFKPNTDQGTLLTKWLSPV
jgi:hypothetical protein